MLLCLVSTPSYAQIPISTGKMLEFFHGVDQFTLTQKYQMCVDAVTDAACPDVVVTTSTTIGWYQFPLPTSVTMGIHFIGVRAVGFSGDKSNVSNALHILVGPPIDPNALVPPSSFRVVP